MTNLTQKLWRQFFGASVRVVTLALFLVVFGASAALAQTRLYVPNILSNNVSVTQAVDERHALRICASSFCRSFFLL